MFIQINFESDVPIYEQLKNQIIIGIAKKELAPGDRLPSVRKLASDIGINLHTVNKAYKQLEEKGFLIIHRQKGVIINPDGPPKADETYTKTLKETLLPMIAELELRGIDKINLLSIINEIYEQLEVDRDE